MLRQQSAISTDELKEAAELEHLGAISLFYTGRELQLLLCPTAPAPHSPQLLVLVEAITVTRITVTSWRAYTLVFITSQGQYRVQVETGDDGTVYVSNIRPVELGYVLCVVEVQLEDKGLAARLE